jgi:phosphotransferase system enzyme I (PtsP)
MLNILKRITQELYMATNLDEALAISVRRIRECMAVDACSVLIADGSSGHYVLTATDGLNPASLGKVRLAPNEGLVGLVAERREPVSVENAAEHPRYRYFPETGEERFHAFLGVPMIHYRRVVGVLVVHHCDKRLFNKDEEALLVTIAAQLAGAISDSIAGGGISRLMSDRISPSSFIQGIPAAPGIALGTAVLASPFASLNSIPDRIIRDVATEAATFRSIVAAVQEELRASAKRMATFLPDEARAIFNAYVMLLGDDRFISDTIKRIHAGNWAPAALRDTINDYARLFEQMEDSYLRARAEDIRDIGQRILSRLQKGIQTPPQYPERSILVGEEISAAQLLEVPIERLAGIVCTRGSVLSHTAILARALGIPAVMGIGDLSIRRLEDSPMAVDGYLGHVLIKPTPSLLAEFQRLVHSEEELITELDLLRHLPAETPDGFRIPLYANSGLPCDIRPSLERGAEGIGLYRTEFTFMVYESFPSEDQQYQIYRQVLESFAPKPVTMRTLDIGGDKSLPYFPVSEDNALLGWRGIRVSLDHPEIFLTQLRAMLRANVGVNNLRILFPMISNLKEVDQAKDLLERAHRDLLREGLVTVKPPLGVLIEVPAAIYQITSLAQRVDFFSIGTNDLTQYLLAANRNNVRVATLCDSLNPAVIRAIYDAVQGVQRYGRPISVCGEMAGDPAAVLVLLGMGISTLSMASPNLPRIKWVIRRFTRYRARELLEEALNLEDATQVRKLLNNTLEQGGLGALVRVVR